MSTNLNYNEDIDSNANAETRSLKDAFFDLTQIEKRFLESINEIESQFNIYDDMVAKNIQSADNILRSQIFFLDSALDLYVHEIIKYGFLQIIDGTWKKCKDNYVISVKVNVLQDLLQGSNKDDQNIKKTLLEELSYSIKTCMKFDAITSQLSLVKIFLPKSVKKELKQDIDELSNRRNLIGHNSDVDKKTNVKSEISKDLVKKYIERVKEFQQIIQKATENADNKNKEPEFGE